MFDVIIPTTGNRLTQLQECLNSLFKQTQPIEIIIVFGRNVSLKNKWQILEICQKHNITILFEPSKNLKGSHRAVACNYGLKHSNSEYVAFVDDDVSVSPTWAESSLKYFKDNVAGVTSGSTPYTSPYHLVQTIGSDAHSKSFTQITEVQSIPGYNSIYLRKALNQIGFFNEKIGGCEDWELNFRLRKAGWKLYGIPETPVEHRHSYTYQSFIKQMFGYGWSRSRLYKVCHIFTLQHAIPTMGLFLLIFLSIINLEMFSVLLAAYILWIFVSIIELKPKTLKTSFRTFFTFLIMHFSWAIGYLKGLFE